jgi:RimJ/RimL family protein N-acetyltransferase
VARLVPLLCNVQTFTFVTGLKVADQFCPIAGALDSSLVKLRRAAAHERAWLTPRLLVLDDRVEVIGVAAFQDRPQDGRVELGYSVAPAYWNRGFATEAVRTLSDHALEFAEVQTVRAHTKAEASASGRVLEKCGFQRVGEMLDPREGLVWSWERSSKKRDLHPERR